MTRATTDRATGSAGGVRSWKAGHRAATIALAALLAGCGTDFAPPLTERSDFQIEEERYAVALPPGASIRNSRGGVEIEISPGRRASPSISLTASVDETRKFRTHRRLGAEAQIAYQVMTAEAGSGGTAAVLDGRLDIGESAYGVACYIQGEDVRKRSAEWCLPLLETVEPLP